MDQESIDAEFAEYVAVRWLRLVRSAVLLGCSATEAEDVVQAALLRCLVHWPRVRVADDRDAYVHRVLINTFISSRRPRWVKERPVAELPDEATQDDVHAAWDATDAVRRSLVKLSVEHRTAVVLRYYAHLTDQQIAAVLGVAPGTVKSRLSRALRLLSDDPHLSDLRGTP